MKYLKSLNREELISQTDLLVKKEREVTAELIRHLCEIEARRLHLELGFGSMFEFLTKYYSYSEGAADRRLSAMRLSKSVPGVMEAIETGTLSLSAASQAHHFFQREEKAGKKYSAERKAEVTQTLAGKSRRDCEQELLRLSPQSAIPAERERVISPDQVEIRFVADAKLAAKLKRIKQLLSHHGDLGYAELIERIADQALKKLDPLERPEKTSSVKSPQPANSPEARIHETPPAVQNENIPSTIQPRLKKGIVGRPKLPIADRRFIWARAQGACEYVDPQSGRRCGSRWALEIDHIVPLAKSGAHERGNLRLCCRSHNQWLAIQQFGLPFMTKYLGERKNAKDVKHSW